MILFILLDLPTRAGSPQQHKPITVGPFFLPNPPCQLSLWEETGVPGENPRLRQSVDFLLFSHEDWVRVALRKYLVRFEPAASEVKGKCANHLATEALECCTADLFDFSSTANRDVKMLIIVYEESANNLLKRKSDL